MSEKATNELNRRSLRSSSNLPTKTPRQSSVESTKLSASNNKLKTTISEKENVLKVPRTNKDNRTLTSSLSNTSEICLDSDSEDKYEKGMKNVEKKRNNSKKATNAKPYDNSDIIIIDSDSDQPSTSKDKEYQSKTMYFKKNSEASSNSQLNLNLHNDNELRASKRKIVELEADTSGDMGEMPGKIQKKTSSMESPTRKSTSQLISQVNQIPTPKANNDNNTTEIFLEEDKSFLRSSSRLAAKEPPTVKESQKNSRQYAKNCARMSCLAIPRCGLCGKKENLIRTECCGRYICNDLSKFEILSLTNDSCFRNHHR
jgi:hypothetical protein